MQYLTGSLVTRIILFPGLIAQQLLEVACFLQAALDVLVLLLLKDPLLYVLQKYVSPWPLVIVICQLILDAICIVAAPGTCVLVPE
jgi:hypothetical protein